METIDAVIVGGGLAGLAAGYRLASAGRQVILLERGDAPGSKNVSGGRIYVEPLRRYLPEIVEEAPFERHVVKEMLAILDGEGSVILEHSSAQWHKEPYMSHTVLRARFDNWLSEKAMEKGCFVIPRRKVDDLLWENGRVAGVKAGGEEVRARIVIACDGALSFMAEKAGLRSSPAKPADYAVAMKEIYRLDPSTIEDRFGLEAGEGAACLFAGAVTKGMFGGGFLYTNSDTLSVGLVIGVEALMGQTAEASHQLMEAFTARPEVLRWTKGAELKEYAAHVIPEAGIGGISRLYTDNMLVAGDAAGFALNLGLTVRGMEFAMASGVLAAEVADEAIGRDDTSAKFLSLYEKKLKETFVLQDMETFRHSRQVLDNPRLLTIYPKFVCELLQRLFTVDGGPKASLYRTAKEVARRYVLTWEGFKDFLTFRKM